MTLTYGSGFRGWVTYGSGFRGWVTYGSGFWGWGLGLIYDARRIRTLRVPLTRESDDEFFRFCKLFRRLDSPQNRAWGGLLLKGIWLGLKGVRVPRNIRICIHICI